SVRASKPVSEPRALEENRDAVGREGAERSGRSGGGDCGAAGEARPAGHQPDTALEHVVAVGPLARPAHRRVALAAADRAGVKDYIANPQAVASHDMERPLAGSRFS